MSRDRMSIQRCAAFIHRVWRKVMFPLVGFAALLWFLVRVVPKPSRASYPCMRAAFPVATSFILYMIGLTASAFAATRMKEHWRQGRYWLAGAFFVIAVIGGLFVFQEEELYAYMDTIYLETPNQPIGTAQGIFPGRVVWARNPDATNENCTNNSFGDAYHLAQNTNMDSVQNMMNRSILALTGEDSIAEAWQALFRHFNERQGKGAVDYQSTEKIFIKTNGVGISVDRYHNFTTVSSCTMSRTSPQAVLAILRQLVDTCGVPQENICVGDPISALPNDYWNIWRGEFPDVKYICKQGGFGRIQSVAGADPVVFYSDRGTVLRTGTWSDATAGEPVYDDRLYTVIEEADYLINVAALKAHHRAGITLMAKNHFGSHSRSNALHVHNGLVNPDGVPIPTPPRAGYGLYRVLVDIMGHEKLGGNTLLFVVDGLWGGPDAVDPPVKFEMAPFNSDWPSSIFMSQDQVALASVCFDFLRTEFTISNEHEKTYPLMDGVDDYLHQAADSANWAEGIRYDPENDGSVLASLGVHEHWNNAADMQYSRDLGTGDGIELIKLVGGTPIANEPVTTLPAAFDLENNYPNPFNPTTTIRYKLPHASEVSIIVYDVLGREVARLVDQYAEPGYYEIQWNGGGFPSGLYTARLMTTEYSESIKMLLLK